LKAPEVAESYPATTYFIKDPSDFQSAPNILLIEDRYGAITACIIRS
jgi:hypothetical protein